MTVSHENSRIIFNGIKAASISSASALPETWLGLLLQRAEDDPDFDLVQVAKEEEAIGIAAGSWFAGTSHARNFSATSRMTGRHGPYVSANRSSYTVCSVRN
jgi:sulfopyruvate decarboxylase TPP-binding subunit